MRFPICCRGLPPPSFESAEQLGWSMQHAPELYGAGTRVKIAGRTYKIEAGGRVTEQHCLLRRLWRHCFGDRKAEQREKRIRDVLRAVEASKAARPSRTAREPARPEGVLPSRLPRFSERVGERGGIFHRPVTLPPTSEEEQAVIDSFNSPTPPPKPVPPPKLVPPPKPVPVRGPIPVSTPVAPSTQPAQPVLQPQQDQASSGKDSFVPMTIYDRGVLFKIPRASPRPEPRPVPTPVPRVGEIARLPNVPRPSVSSSFQHDPFPEMTFPAPLTEEEQAEEDRIHQDYLRGLSQGQTSVLQNLGIISKPGRFGANTPLTASNAVLQAARAAKKATEYAQDAERAANRARWWADRCAKLDKSDVAATTAAQQAATEARAFSEAASQLVPKVAFMASIAEESKGSDTIIMAAAEAQSLCREVQALAEAAERSAEKAEDVARAAGVVSQTSRR